MGEREREGKPTASDRGCLYFALIGGLLIYVTAALLARPELGLRSLEILNEILTSHGDTIGLTLAAIVTTYTGYQELREKARHGTRRLTASEFSQIFKLTPKNEREKRKKNEGAK
jgi:hypothetical protein